MQITVKKTPLCLVLFLFFLKKRAIEPVAKKKKIAVSLSFQLCRIFECSFVSRHGLCPPPPTQIYGSISSFVSFPKLKENCFCVFFTSPKESVALQDGKEVILKEGTSLYLLYTTPVLLQSNFAIAAIHNWLLIYLLPTSHCSDQVGEGFPAGAAGHLPGLLPKKPLRGFSTTKSSKGKGGKNNKQVLMSVIRITPLSNWWSQVLA